jgi:hypothetical protein
MEAAGWAVPSGRAPSTRSSRGPSGIKILISLMGSGHAALGEWVCVLLLLPGGRPAALSCLPSAARAVCRVRERGDWAGWAVG